MTPSFANGTKIRKWGFSVVDQRGNSKKEVPVIYFAKWIERNGHRLLGNVYGNELSGEERKNVGKVVMKLDIEGMEYIVGPASLLFSGVMSNV